MGLFLLLDINECLWNFCKNFSLCINFFGFYLCVCLL